MQVDQIMMKDPACCTDHDSLNEAARVMWDHDCGFVPVVASHDSRQLVGVITDRDVCMAAYTRGVPLRSLEIRDAMSTSVTSCRTSDSVADVEARMQQAQVRRLPVVNDEGQLVGVVSLADLARQATSLRGSKKIPGDLADATIGELLGSITAPRNRALAVSA